MCFIFNFLIFSRKVKPNFVTLSEIFTTNVKSEACILLTVGDKMQIFGVFDTSQNVSGAFSISSSVTGIFEMLKQKCNKFTF